MELESLEQRVHAIELWVGEQKVREARDDERRIHMDKRFDDLESRFDKMAGGVNRVVWIMAAAIFGAFLKFALSGGLTHLPL